MFLLKPGQEYNDASEKFKTHWGEQALHLPIHKQQPETHSKKELKVFKYMGSYFLSAKSDKFASTYQILFIRI